MSGSPEIDLKTRSELQRPAAPQPRAEIEHFSALPPRAFVVPLLVRGIIIWAGMRVITGLAIAILQAGSPVRLPAITAFAVAFTTGMLCWLEARRRHEQLLLGNLGIGGTAIFLIGLVPAVLVECLLQVANHVSA